MLKMQISLLDVLSRKDCYQSDISTILYHPRLLYMMLDRQSSSLDLLILFSSCYQASYLPLGSEQPAQSDS